MQSPEVIPSVNPTVPTAEAVSNRHMSIGRPSIMLIARPPKKNSVKYITRIVAAFLITLSPILRPKKQVFSLRRNVETAVPISTAIVVVFMPPAVEPGLPPISIRKIKIYCPASLNSDRSMVLKPAVRVVTD